MRHSILTSSILPPRVQRFHEPDDEGGGGNAVIAEQSNNKPGAAFSAMLKSMGDEDASGGGDSSKKEKAQEVKKAEAPAGDVKEKDKKEDANNGNGKPPDKKKTTPHDPLLSALTGDAGSGDPSTNTKKEAPAKTEEVKPKSAEEKAREVEAATKGMSGKAADNFRHVVGERDAAQEQVAQLNAEIARLKGLKPELPSDVKQKLDAFEKLQKEHGELAETLERIGVERSPSYQQKYVQRRTQLMERAKQTVTRYGGDAKAFAEAMELQGRERSQAIAAAMENMESFDQSKVTSLVVEMENLDEEGANFLKNSKQILQEEERRAQAEEQAQAVEIIKARRAKFVEVANTMLHRFPDDHPMAAEANPLVDQAIKDAEKFLFENTTFEDFTKASIAHALFPTMQKNLASATAKILELESQLEAYAESDPGNGGSGGGDGKPSKDEPKGLAQRFVAAQQAG